MLEARNAGKPIGVGARRDRHGDRDVPLLQRRAGAADRRDDPGRRRAGVHGPRADGRRGADHAVELPAGDRVVEDGAGAGGGQHGGVEARRADAADRAAVRGAGAGGRAAGGRRQRRGRAGADRAARGWWSTPTSPRSRSPGSTEVGPLDRRGRVGDDQARDAGAGRQVGQRGLRGRRHRGGGRGGAVGGVRQRRPGLLRALADPRGARRGRRLPGGPEGRRRGDPRRRPARPGDRDGAA